MKLRNLDLPGNAHLDIESRMIDLKVPVLGKLSLINILVHKCAQRLDFYLASATVIFWATRCRLTSPRRRFIVITLIEHIGDIVACEPVAQFVREEEPDAFIVWCIKKQYREIVESNPNIDHVLDVFCLTTWIRLRSSGLFDRIIDLHIQGRICPHCRIPLNKKEGDLDITLENYLAFGPLIESFSRSAGLSINDAQPRLRIPDRASRYIDGLTLPEEYIVIHCHSNEDCKDWPDIYWNEAIDRLIYKTKLAILEVGNVSHLNRCDSEFYQNYCGKLSILETAEVIRRARLFVGVDSGPAHVANAVGTFGVVLIGKYRGFDRYNPFTGGYADGSNAILVETNGPVATVTVDMVLNAIGSVFSIVTNTFTNY